MLNLNMFILTYIVHYEENNTKTSIRRVSVIKNADPLVLPSSLQASMQSETSDTLEEKDQRSTAPTLVSFFQFLTINIGQ